MSIFFDLHGVLVNSEKMHLAYKQVLRKIYSRNGYTKDQADQFHEAGLNLFNHEMKRLLNLKLVDTAFYSAVEKVDDSWTKLMQSFISKPIEDKNILETRVVEREAGLTINCFYSDANQLLKWILSNSEQDIYITSNAHSAHIEGILEGAGFLEWIDPEKILGWDKMGCLKNTVTYYNRLKEKAKFNSFLIGNSSEEIILASKANFDTILIIREQEVSKQAVEVANIVKCSLTNLQEDLFNNKCY